MVGLVGCSDNGGGVTPPPSDGDGGPTITLTAPSGGAALMPGETVTIAWTASDDDGAVGVDLS